MSKTRKLVVCTLGVIFEGDYIPTNQIEDYLVQWIEAGLEDRDDLKSWSLSSVLIREVSLESTDAEDEAA